MRRDGVKKAMVVGLIFVIFLLLLLRSRRDHFQSHTVVQQIQNKQGNYDSINQIINKTTHEINDLKERKDSISRFAARTYDSLKKIKTVLKTKSTLEAQFMQSQSILQDCSDKVNKAKVEVDSLVQIITAMDQTNKLLLKQIYLLSADHSLAVLFMLHASLSYYDVSQEQKQQILKHISLVSRLIDSTFSLQTSSNAIFNADEQWYKGIRWAEEKAACSPALSALVLKLYGFEPSTITITQYKQFLVLLFSRLSQHERLCNQEVRNIFADSTQSRIANTIFCLKVRLNMNEKR